ncbi:hypothetical protein SAMN05444748_108137 [Variovorax sp. OV700]|nr:hypothetical protein SAMN05444748_108137 [Variovorax sp. OV700]
MGYVAAAERDRHSVPLFILLESNLRALLRHRFWPVPAVGRILHVPCLAAAPIGRPFAPADESSMAR